MIVMIFIDNRFKSTLNWFLLYSIWLVKKPIEREKKILFGPLNCLLWTIYAQRIILIYSNHNQTLSNISRPIIYYCHWDPFTCKTFWIWFTFMLQIVQLIIYSRTFDFLLVSTAFDSYKIFSLVNFGLNNPKITEEIVVIASVL